MILFLLAFFTLGVAHAEVWPTENQWSPAWETQYRTWVRENEKADMFSRVKNADGTPNPYYGIRVDCADTVYSLRLIFAYENRLPYVISNPVSRTAPAITNTIQRFDKTPEGHERLRRFLRWVHGIVSTHSLARDTYSIPFNSVHPGTVILTSRKNHHSWTISDISKTGNPTLIFNSTVGRESGFQVQIRKSWPNPHWIFEPVPSVDNPNRTITL